MSARILDGKGMAQCLQESIADKVKMLTESGFPPGLAVVLLGDDPASISYVTSKERDCWKVGIHSQDIRLPKETKEAQLLTLLDTLNHDVRIHGILVQLPLPKDFDEEKIIRAISPEKDVDAFHPLNWGKMMLGLETFLPCTPHGIIKMLELAHIPTKGSDIVVLGRSRIVGAPLANLFSRKAPGGNATVTLCHTETKNLVEKVQRADIVVSATGKVGSVRAEMIKKGAVVIDVGINRVDDPSQKKGYRLVGDVDFEAVKEIASAISPVPGGVGPLTRTMLLWNTVSAAQAFYQASLVKKT